MESVVLCAVHRQGMARRLMHLMHVAGRQPVGLIAPANEQDRPNLPRPYVSCIALAWADVETARDAQGLRIAVKRPDLRELQHDWKCEYLGYDQEVADPPCFNATVFKPPRGRSIAFISRACFRALHGGAQLEVVEESFDAIA